MAEMVLIGESTAAAFRLNEWETLSEKKPFLSATLLTLSSINSYSTPHLYQLSDQTTSPQAKHLTLPYECLTTHPFMSINYNLGLTIAHRYINSQPWLFMKQLARHSI